MHASAPASARVGTRPHRWGFAVYAAVALVHVVCIAVDAESWVYPTKLLLMPALALAVLAAGSRGAAAIVLLAAIGFSWLGDGAALFFPFLADELPAMLLCFGVAHLAYIAIFARFVRPQRVPPWAVVYALWWGVLLAVLWPHLGGLLVAVAIYGVVLAGTAVLATRGGTITAIGGAFFLASDTILALRLFLPGGLSESLAGPWIMLTYTVGQGLLAYGIVSALRGRS